MVWFKNDDGFYDHPKVMSIPRSIRAEAAGTWLLAGTYCARHLTNGVIPIHMIEELAGTLTGADALVKAKLWTKTRKEYRFKSWDDYQPTRSEVEEARESERVRKAEYRSRRKNPGKSGVPVPQMSQWDTGGTPSGTGAGVPAHPTRPDPTRPDLPPLTTFEGGASASPPVDNSEEDPEPPTRCPTHLSAARPPKCGACKDARLDHERWEIRHLAAEKTATARPPAWNPATHCEHGQHRDRCEICDYEARRASTVIAGPWGAA